jgi:predicted MFS family arabinose efflux permease
MTDARPVREGPTPGRALALAIGIQASAVLPLILLGTMAVSIRDDLGFDEAGLGVLLATCFGVGALLSVASGRVTERIGAARGVRLAGITAAVSLLGVAIASRNWLTLVPFFATAGLGIALVQPATDVWLARTLPLSRHGVAFGMKQAAGGPGVGVLAGLAVPVLAGTIGWRGAFAVGAIAALLVTSATVGVSLNEPPRRAVRSREGDVSLRPLVVLAFAGGVATISQAAFVSFAVSAAVASGLSEGLSGLIFAAGGVVGFLARLLAGHVADRRAGGLLMMTAGMLGASAAGFLMLATERPVVVGVAMPLLCATAWGWQGLYFLAIARSNPNSPAAASGIAAAGLLTGAVIGPVAFGLLARDDYSLAWAATAASTLVAVAAILVGRELVKREIAGRPIPIVVAAR